MTLVAAACFAAGAAAADLSSPIGSGSEPAPPWRLIGLPRQTKPMTRFTVVELDRQRVLRVEADHAFGNLLHPLRRAHAGTLTWRWRVDELPAGADLQRRSGDDAPLKVCALFDLPAEQVPFVDRQLLRIASARAGEPLPTATLCYVWDRSLPDGALLHNAYTHRVRYIIVRGTPGRWSDERHDLAADFRRAFGDDSDNASDVPGLTGVGIGADSDNTASHSIGYVSDLHLSERP
uniref:Pyridine nucleotide-disulfide oxidoreductase n=1 Tax=uncultured bacterium 51 TaxID=1748279 RepID=A0A0U3T315_9BACT|nr:pyridine nucleotide-disulfide oxidoreductase [uncultured bacterium 51]